MKEKLRKEIKEKRRKLSKEENRKKSKEIKERLFGLKEFMGAETVLFYISYDGEVFTHDMIKEAMKEKRVVVPISNKEDCSLSLSELNNLGDLEIGSYNILEPKKDCRKKVSIDEIDLIIVPGVGFDEHGCRMGNGIGYYDSLLKDSSNALNVALAFECQIVDEIPTEKHDIPVDKIVTEKRIIDCKS